MINIFTREITSDLTSLVKKIDETVGVTRRAVRSSSGRVQYVDPPPARVYSGEAIRFIPDTCSATEK